MPELRVAAKPENLEQVMAFVDGELEAQECPLKAQTQIDVAMDELFMNIANYAYGEGTGDAVIRAEVRDGCAEITLLDWGVPFNPLEHAEPDVSLSAEERQIGGLGIYLVRKTMDSVSYRYEDGQNILTICKKL